MRFRFSRRAEADLDEITAYIAGDNSARAVTYVRELREHSSRPAGVSRFEGIYAYEVLRRIVGDAAAEEFLLVDYHVPKPGAGAPNVAHNVIDVGDGDRVDIGPQLAARRGPELGGTVVLISPLPVHDAISPVLRLAK